MATEVMLLERVEDLGRAGDVVKVSDGYARNYLLPKKLAAPVNAGNQRRLIKLKAEQEAKYKAEVEATQALMDRAAKLTVEIVAKVGQDEKLFGSVTSMDIADALKKLGVEIDRRRIHLEHPIKELGTHEVKVKLLPEVEGSVKVCIVKE